MKVHGSFNTNRKKIWEIVKMAFSGGPLAAIHQHHKLNKLLVTPPSHHIMCFRYSCTPGRQVAIPIATMCLFSIHIDSGLMVNSLVRTYLSYEHPCTWEYMVNSLVHTLAVSILAPGSMQVSVVITNISSHSSIL